MYVIQIRVCDIDTYRTCSGRTLKGRTMSHKLLEEGQRTLICYTNTQLVFSYSFLYKGKSYPHHVGMLLCGERHPLVQQVFWAGRVQHLTSTKESVREQGCKIRLGRFR